MKATLLKCPACGSTDLEKLQWNEYRCTHCKSMLRLDSEQKCLELAGWGCPECGLENPIGQRFCTQCGTKLGKMCPRCRALNYLDVRYCGSCGFAFRLQEAYSQLQAKLVDLRGRLATLQGYQSSKVISHPATVMPSWKDEKWITVYSARIRLNREIARLEAIKTGLPSRLEEWMKDEQRVAEERRRAEEERRRAAEAAQKRIIPERETTGLEGSLQQWFKRRSRLGKIAILATVPLVLCCLCVGLPSLNGPTRRPAPTLAPTDTPVPLPTPSGLPTVVFSESVNKQIFRDWVDAQSTGMGDEDARAEIERRWGITVDRVKAIVAEGIQKSWMPTATPIPIPPTPTPTPNGKSRFSPVPMGQPVVADNKLRLTVLGVERDAWARIHEANMFNPEPGEGMEYIIVTIQVRNLAAPTETRIVSEFHLRVTGERGTIYSRPFVILERKELNAEFFGGATIEGEIPFEVGQGEKNLVLIYDPGWGSTARYLSLGKNWLPSATTATPIPLPPTQPVVEIIPTRRPTTLPTSCNAVTEIPRAECEALVALYNSTDGANWNHNDVWLDTNTLCAWYGLKCEAHHVTELNMLNNHLHGTIPSELDSLTELRVLDLWGNHLVGSIPPRLGNLRNLRTFRVYGNVLTGNIPPELGNLIYLQNLTLSSNRLSGKIPPELGKLVNLRELHLHSNRLSGGVPSELGNLTNLWKLHIANNQLSGALPKTLMKLTKLSAFNYRGTNLCAPADAAFQTWLAGISDLQATGITCP